MPIIDVVSKEALFQDRIISSLCKLLAKELTCGERKLTENDFSVRFHIVTGKMSGEIEISIFAHSYEERVARADEIASNVAKQLTKQTGKKVKVSLMLTQMGYSF